MHDGEHTIARLQVARDNRSDALEALRRAKADVAAREREFEQVDQKWRRLIENARDDARPVAGEPT